MSEISNVLQLKIHSDIDGNDAFYEVSYRNDTPFLLANKFTKFTTKVVANIARLAGLVVWRLDK